ncbi:PP2C family protein-serine/threonine phosphatase [Terriglobus aquaticus]|uniref:PP2C family protein-serine/threonine phosphatase n=1 Tax=Terriglobus aquaticus TaxID=940139 RepID=A0ABW9KFA4_9BACT|nr:PP2C family protein-serine/threonine phosphatase [Terriglobus aquaticus]
METTSLQEAEGTLSLEEQVARLQALLEASRQVHSAVSTDGVLSQTVRILVRELELQGAVFLATGTDRLLASSGTPLTPPYEDCSRFSLPSKDGTPPADLLVKTHDGRNLSLYEEDFIEGLILQAAVALEMRTYTERAIEWARVQQDMEAARSIQRSLLPKTMPAVPGYSFAARSIACYEVGGDYLDTMQLADGSHLLIVADVAGKGLASAIMATSFRSAFRSLASQAMPLLDMVCRVNEQHWAEGDEARRRYVTAIFVRLDSANSRIDVVNAGHNPGALVRSDGSVQMIEASGTPLGLLPFATYSLESFDFDPGSKLLLYTDGLTEVFCGDEEFGCERLTESFRRLHTQNADQALNEIWEKLEQFSTGEPQTDDMTALAVCHIVPEMQEA